MAQISRDYKGSIPELGSSAARLVSYGVTTTANMYGNKTDFINSTIATFLSNDCGVPAKYEVRNGSEAKFLWIYNIPFLIGSINSSSNYQPFYGPYNGTYYWSNNYTKFFNSHNSVNYDFSLYFTGNASTGFYLRMRSTGYTTPASASSFRFGIIKATNILNNKSAVVWVAGNSTDQRIVGQVYAVDLNTNNTMDQNSYCNTANTNLYMETSLETTTQSYTLNQTKLPLVPIRWGAYSISGFYLRPMNFALPDAARSDVALQTEISAGSRTFIVTQNDVPDGYTANLGLIEVT